MISPKRLSFSSAASFSLSARSVERRKAFCRDEACLPGEDREDVELRAKKEALHPVVAHVEHAGDVTRGHERRAHDARQLQREDALARLELLVGQGVADDDRASRLEHALDDAVGDGRLAHAFAEHVARSADAKLRRASARGRLVLVAVGGLVEQEDEPLLGSADVDHGVEHRFEHLVDALQRHQLLAEVVELADARDRLPRGPELRLRERRRRGGRRRVALCARRRARLVEHAELELGVAEGEAVAVNEPGAPLLLAVDEDVALFVDLLEVEVAPVEQDLGVGLRHLLPLDAHVVTERGADGAHGLEQREHVGRPLGRKPLEDGHAWPSLP